MALNYEKIMAYRPADIRASYGPRDCMLYALGIGIGMDPLDLGQLKFVYEKSLAAFPTLATALGWMGRLTDPVFRYRRADGGAGRSARRAAPAARSGRHADQPALFKEIIDKGEGNAAHHPDHARSDAGGRHARCNRRGFTLARKHGGFGGKVTQYARASRNSGPKPGRNLRSADAAQSRAAFPAHGRHQSAAYRPRARQGRGFRSADPAWHGEVRRCRACHFAHARGLPARTISRASRRVSPGPFFRARRCAQRCGRTAPRSRSAAARSSAARSRSTTGSPG